MESNKEYHSRSQELRNAEVRYMELEKSRDFMNDTKDGTIRANEGTDSSVAASGAIWSLIVAQPVTGSVKPPSSDVWIAKMTFSRAPLHLYKA